MSFGGALMSFVALFVCAALRFVDGSVVCRCGVLPVEAGGRADRHAPKQGGRTGDGAAPKDLKARPVRTRTAASP